MDNRELIGAINEVHKNLLPGYLGIELISASAEEVTGTLKIRDNLCTVGKIVHGGAIVTLADTMAAVCAFLNLEPGTKTTTVELKTNFVRPGRPGDTLTAKSRIINKGRTIMLFYTEISDSRNQLIAAVTQTQIVIHKK